MLEIAPSHKHQLRSANIPTCEVPRTLNHFGNRSPALTCRTLSHQHSSKVMPVLTASNEF